MNTDTANEAGKLRRHAEQQFAEELEELKKTDGPSAPTCSAANWKTASP